MQLKSILVLAGTAALFASLVTNGYLLAHWPEDTLVYSDADRRMIDKAFAAEVAFEHSTMADERHLNRAVAIAFAHEICVQLYPGPGVVGGKKVYCFDRKTERLIRRELYGQ